MGTRMSYEDFEQQYLSQAAVLTTDDADAEAAVKLCRTTYSLMTAGDMSKVKKVYLKLAAVYYDGVPQNNRSDTARLVGHIFGRVPVSASGHLVGFDKWLSVLGPILGELPLHIRLIGALQCLGWTNLAIADLYNAILSDVSKELQDKMTLTEASALLARIRDNCCHRLVASDSNHLWLSRVIRQEGDAAIEISAMEAFRELSRRDIVSRFARKGDIEGDRYGWLRDKWQRAKEHLLATLDLRKFLEDGSRWG